MKCFLVALVSLAVVGQLAAAAARSNSLEWALYKRQHGKAYGAEEEARRFANFLATKALVESHNADSSHTYKLALNHLADWTEEERAKLNGFKFDENLLSAERELSADDQEYLDSILNDDEPLPKEVDWRKVPGRVSDVKNQGQCGSCWAFSTTGMLEGQQVSRKLFKEIKTLSEQDLVDCSGSNSGCDGGIMEYALNDIKRLGGIMSEGDYPYLADDDTCMFNKTKSVMTDAGAIVLKKDELQLRKMVAKYGPVSVAFFATEKFQAYSAGVFSDMACPVGKLNHAVLIVGYGTDIEAGDYWLIKNSWDEVWGDGGYFKIKRGVNMCGIETIPTIAKF